jgi:RNA polymerase sigma factor (sigma-70 family)
MTTIDSGSIEEVNIRLTNLHNNHHKWLYACAYNQSKDTRVSEDLVQELYLYLATKRNPKLFYNDSFNLLYCHNFIRSRYINFIKRENKTSLISETPSERIDKEDSVYDIEYDKKLHHAYDMIKEELERLSKTKMWSSSKLYELYAFSELTMEELSTEIGLSKSTVFLNIKKIKEHLKEVINNPFNDEQNKQ